jgi:hypothetical protein
MNSTATLQIGIAIVLAAGLITVGWYAGAYDEVHTGIVNVLCLSCIKLQPITEVAFTFDTYEHRPHPKFIQENLTAGVVFLAYREDVCAACDDMEPLLQQIFQVSFEKEDTVVSTSEFNNVTVTFFHINLDHARQELINAYPIYDQLDLGAVPMFTVITYGYDRGFIKPYYATVYGKLDEEDKTLSNPERIQKLTNIIIDGTELWLLNHNGG